MFSIVMPVWNKRPLIERTVATIFAQSFADFELIAVDDGSTDGSFEPLEALDDPRLRLLRQPNGGAGKARNTGIEAARHGWIAFIDADDLWLPGHLAELDRVRTRHPEAGLIGTGFVVTDRAGRFEPPAEREDRISAIRYFAEIGRGGDPMWVSSSAIRRDVYDRVGGFGDDPVGQDSEYLARVALAFPVAASTRRTAVYVVGTGGNMDAGRARWSRSEMRSRAELSAAAALIEERYPGIESGELRRDLDLYLTRYLGWCLKGSVALGDVRTIRRLRPLYRTPPPLEHRLLLAAARLPSPAARVLYRLGLGAKAALRRLRGIGI